MTSRYRLRNLRKSLLTAQSVFKPRSRHLYTMQRNLKNQLIKWRPLTTIFKMKCSHIRTHPLKSKSFSKRGATASCAARSNYSNSSKCRTRHFALNNRMAASHPQVIINASLGTRSHLRKKVFSISKCYRTCKVTRT